MGLNTDAKNAVAAGEESGNLPQSLEIVRQQLSKSYDLRRKVRGAMIYPAIIVTVIIVIGILMMIFMVPNLSGMFKELHVELPLSTRLIIGISDFLSHHTIAFVITLIALIAATVRLLKTKRGVWLVAWTALRFPVVKTIVKNLNSAITMRTISSLVSSGVSVLEAITITERVIQNSYFKEVLAGAGAMIEKGGNLSTVFKNREDLFPVLVGEMAEVGEETGNLSGMLLKGATIFEEEVDQATKNLSTIIEPVLMIFIGLFVGLFAVSMLGPMYSLSNNI
jgi:type IV pilus assembly protein PilC